MYGKLFERELDSTMVEQPPITRLAWHYMIMLCDEDGRVDMTAAAFARRTNIPLEDVEAAVEALSAPDPLSRTPDAEGRRILPIEGQPYGWQIVNHALYRAMGNREDRRRQNREAQQRWRDRQQGEDGGPDGKPESARVISRKQESAGVKRNKPSDSDAGSDADAGSGQNGAAEPAPPLLDLQAPSPPEDRGPGGEPDPPGLIRWKGSRPPTLIPVELLAADPRFPDRWRTRMHCAGGKKPSPSAEAKQLEALVELLGEAGIDAVLSCVADATRGGWQGIFPARHNGGGRAAPRRLPIGTDEARMRRYEEQFG